RSTRRRRTPRNRRPAGRSRTAHRGTGPLGGPPGPRPRATARIRTRSHTHLELTRPGTTAEPRGRYEGQDLSRTAHTGNPWPTVVRRGARGERSPVPSP